MSDRKSCRNIIILLSKHDEINNLEMLNHEADKIDDGGDARMSSDAIYHSDNFEQLSLPLSTVDLPFGQLSYRFWYPQNKL